MTISECSIDLPWEQFLEEIPVSDGDRASLLTTLSQGINAANKDDYVLAFMLAAALEEQQALQWIRQLYHRPVEEVEALLEESFYDETLKHILCRVAFTQWATLKQDIENPELDAQVIAACFDALALMVVSGRVERDDVITYFKELFQRILDGDINNAALTTSLVETCGDLWPGECLEQIRDCFGQELVDPDWIEMPEVLEAFHKGKVACLNELAEDASPDLVYEDEESADDFPGEAEKMLAQVESELNGRLRAKIKRNVHCPCGSEQKYKDCCAQYVSPPNKYGIKIKQSEISNDDTGVLQIEQLTLVPEADRLPLAEISVLVRDNPAKALERCLHFLPKYPYLTPLYNWTHMARVKLGQWREVAEIIVDSYRRFPDDIYSVFNYTIYLLRRGEPEKVDKLLSGARTLTELFPGRQPFYHFQWATFCFCKGWYHTLVDEVDEAIIYLRLVNQFSQDDVLAEDLHRKISNALFGKKINKC